MFTIFLLVFFFNDTATAELYTLSLHDALPIWPSPSRPGRQWRRSGLGLHPTAPEPLRLGRSPHQIQLAPWPFGHLWQQTLPEPLPLELSPCRTGLAPSAESHHQPALATWPAHPMNPGVRLPNALRP